MVSLLFQNGDTSFSPNRYKSENSAWDRGYKIPCVGVPKINSICFINSILSTLSGRDRLDVLYQLDFRFYPFHLVRIDSMCFIHSISSGERIDSIPGRWRKRRVSRAA